jgi:signal peptidase I
MRRPSTKECCDSWGGRGREPWLAVALSFVLPGAGHIYVRALGRANLFLGLVLGLRVIFEASLLSSICPPLLSVFLGLLCILVLPLAACLDAYWVARHICARTDRAPRDRTKDAWLAVFLSLLVPGLGHVYVRRVFDAIVFTGLYLLTYLLSDGLGRWAASEAIIVCACIHVFVAGRPLSLKAHILAFIVFFLALDAWSDEMRPWLTRKYIRTAGVLSGPSMKPTLLPGDVTVANRAVYQFDRPCINDVIEYEDAMGPRSIEKETHVKRIVAIAGEVVQIRGNVVYVNGERRLVGKSVVETGTVSERNWMLTRGYGVEEPYTVPEGHVFVLGDNFLDSADSRHYGAVPLERIVGKVVKVIWPPRRMQTLPPCTPVPD